MMDDLNADLHFNFVKEKVYLWLAIRGVEGEKQFKLSDAKEKFLSTSSTVIDKVVLALVDEGKATVEGRGRVSTYVLDMAQARKIAPAPVHVAKKRKIISNENVRDYHISSSHTSNLAVGKENGSAGIKNEKHKIKFQKQPLGTREVNGTTSSYSGQPTVAYPQIQHLSQLYKSNNIHNNKGKAGNNNSNTGNTAANNLLVSPNSKHFKVYNEKNNNQSDRERDERDGGERDGRDIDGYCNDDDTGASSVYTASPQQPQQPIQFESKNRCFLCVILLGCMTEILASAYEDDSNTDKVILKDDLRDLITENVSIVYVIRTYIVCIVVVIIIQLLLSLPLLLIIILHLTSLLYRSSCE